MSASSKTDMYRMWQANFLFYMNIFIENREYGRMDPSRWPRGNLSPQKLAITSPTSGGRSVGILHLRTQTMEFKKACTWNT
jgi:hypothetical protein